MPKRTPSIARTPQPAPIAGLIPGNEKRRQLVQATHKAGRALSAHSAMFYTVVAGRLGLSLSDLRAWDLLLSLGPMNAGRVADVTGLSPGAVTGLIRRLQEAGAVSCETDPLDRRRVIVKVVGSFREGPSADYFEGLMARIRGVFNDFSDDELDASCRLMQEMGKLLHDEAVRLRNTGEKLDWLPRNQRRAQKKK
jgi:DNA-binding MarR family transcriptional regulator